MRSFRFTKSLINELEIPVQGKRYEYADALLHGLRIPGQTDGARAAAAICRNNCQKMFCIKRGSDSLEH